MSPLRFRALVPLLASLLWAAPAFSAEHFVRMLSAHPHDKSRNNLFDPPILKIAPGDTVTFLPSEPGHNSATKSGMLPDGAAPWNTKLDQKFSVQLTVEGVYGYICLPHLEVGMVGLILVGDYKRNLEAAKTVRQYGMAREAFDELFAQIEP